MPAAAVLELPKPGTTLLAAAAAHLRATDRPSSHTVACAVGDTKLGVQVTGEPATAVTLIL